MIPLFSAIGRLNLRETPIHEQFRACDVAGVVGCKKNYGFRDLIGRTEPAEWNGVGNHLLALLTHL